MSTATNLACTTKPRRTGKGFSFSLFCLFESQRRVGCDSGGGDGGGRDGGSVDMVVMATMVVMVLREREGCRHQILFSLFSCTCRSIVGNVTLAFGGKELLQPCNLTLVAGRSFTSFLPSLLSPSFLPSFAFLPSSFLPSCFPSFTFIPSPLLSFHPSFLPSLVFLRLPSPSCPPSSTFYPSVLLSFHPSIPPPFLPAPLSLPPSFPSFAFLPSFLLLPSSSFLQEIWVVGTKWGREKHVVA